MVAGDIRILVAEAHDYLREQLAILLDAYEGMRVIGTADNGKKAVDLCTSLRPNIVLIDAVMPALDGFSATRAIRERFSHIQVVILSNGFIGEHRIAMDAGAKALLHKPLSSEEIAKAIRAVHTGSYNWSLLS